MRAFDVSMPDGRPFHVPFSHRAIREDTVFYGDRDPITADEVKRSLVNHDGYPPDIEVTERRNARRRRK